MQDDKKLNIAILGATLDSTNMGVCALAAGAVRCFVHAYQGADIHFLHFANSRTVQTLTLDGEQVRVPVIPMRFSKRLFLPNNIALLTLLALLVKIVPSKAFRNWVLSKNACLAEIDAIDLFASIAGGDSFSDIYGMERYFYVSLPQILVLLLGKKLVLLPQTYGPFRGGLAKSLTRFILKGADHVYSRDLQGLEEIKTLVGPGFAPSKFEFCYDVGFILQPVAPARVDLAGLASLDEHAGPLVGLNVSGLLFMGGYTRDNMFGLRARLPPVQPRRRYAPDRKRRHRPTRSSRLRPRRRNRYGRLRATLRRIERQVPGPAGTIARRLQPARNQICDR